MNLKESFRWFQRGAELGSASARCALGVAYTEGRGVDFDFAQAVKWLRPLADEGNACGLCNLGFLYEKGWGVPRSGREAMRLSRQSAELGSAGCQFNVGAFYRDGTGTIANPTEAYFWFSLADRGRVPQADVKARQMRARLGPEQIATIERRLATWKPSEGEQP